MVRFFIHIMLILTPFAIVADGGIPTIESARIAFDKISTNESIGTEFLLKTKNTQQLNQTIIGYRAGVMMIMAKHAFNPYSKWKYFSDGQTLLEQTIKSQPQNIELIFIRFCIQTNAPSFLGYNKEIKSDYVFLSEKTNQLTDKDLRNKIITYLRMIENKNLYPNLLLSKTP